MSKRDAQDALNLKFPAKLPSKETLNNYDIIRKVSGIDPYEDMETAYCQAVEKLGIDFIAGVPEKPKRRFIPGETHYAPEKGRIEAHLGIHSTSVPMKYPFNTVDEIISYDPEEEHYKRSIDELVDEYQAGLERDRSLVKDTALVYRLYYTTLFMWGVEIFGWELFMMAATLKENEFDDLLEKFKKVSVRYLTAWEKAGVEQIICHDDLASTQGPIFHPDWYRKHIFPRYKEIFAPFKEKGKKVLFCSDGNITPFLDDLLEAGVDGFMMETPATDFKNIIEKCGKNKVIIGGVDTKILTFKNPEEIDRHVKEVIETAKDCPGFFFSSPGGIHGNIPLENLEAYFSARRKYGKELRKGITK